MDTTIFVSAMLIAISTHECGHWAIAECFGILVVGVEFGRGSNPGRVWRRSGPKIVTRWTFPVLGLCEIPDETGLPPMQLAALALAGPLAEVVVLLAAWNAAARLSPVISAVLTIRIGMAVQNLVPSATKVGEIIGLTDGGLLVLAYKKWRHPNYRASGYEQLKATLYKLRWLIGFGSMIVIFGIATLVELHGFQVL